MYLACCAGWSAFTLFILLALFTEVFWTGGCLLQHAVVSDALENHSTHVGATCAITICAYVLMIYASMLDGRNFRSVSFVPVAVAFPGLEFRNKVV